jgi:hypothetical protein
MFSCDVSVLWKTTPRHWALPAYPVTRRHIHEEQKHKRKPKNSIPTFGVKELSCVGDGKALDW